MRQEFVDAVFREGMLLILAMMVGMLIQVAMTCVEKCAQNGQYQRWKLMLGIVIILTLAEMGLIVLILMAGWQLVALMFWR